MRDDQMLSDLELIETQYRTAFCLTESGRIMRTNSADQSAGPRLWLAGCAAGNLFGLSFDVVTSLSDIGAELGIMTPKAYRGRGMAAAAAAGWSRLGTLSTRALFYSTSRENISSQRVTARLGLRLIGANLAIT